MTLKSQYLQRNMHASMEIELKPEHLTVAQFVFGSQQTLKYAKLTVNCHVYVILHMHLLKRRAFLGTSFGRFAGIVRWLTSPSRSASGCVAPPPVVNNWNPAICIFVYQHCQPANDESLRPQKTTARTRIHIFSSLRADATLHPQFVPMCGQHQLKDRRERRERSAYRPLATSESS